MLDLPQTPVGGGRCFAHTGRQQAGRLGHLPDWARRALVFVYGAIVCPFVDFFARYGWTAVVLLLFIGLFRLSDIAMGVMANPFYIDLGFTKDQIANVSKIYGFVMSILGALLGGALVFRTGAARLLMPAVFLIAASNLTFAWLAWVGQPDTLILTIAISIDNLVSGMAGSIFIAFLSGLTNTAYTATQYALFTSIMTLPGKLLGGSSSMARGGSVRAGRAWCWISRLPSSSNTQTSIR